jgi:transposase
MPTARWAFVGTPRRYELADAQWARLAPLLPPRRPGAVRKDDRLVVNAILWKLATGAPWRDLPERFGAWQSVYTRFWRWTRAGVWDRLLAAVQRQADAAGRLDWERHFVDGTVVRAHQHAAGAKGGTRRPRRSGAARAASAPRSTSAPRAAASR